jgi:hypothetical protein
MARAQIPYEGSATPGHYLDSEDYGGTPKVVRETVQVGGVAQVEIAEVKSANPTTGLAGLVTRTRERTNGTATLANVADANVSTTLLAANAERIGAIIVNDSTETLFLKYGATASSTSYTAKLAPQQAHDVRPGYTGIIDGIWTGDGAGAARVTEW